MNMRERSFEVRRATRASRVAVLVLLIAAVVVASMPYWAGRDTLRDFTQIASYLVFAMMWNLLAGYGGMVSIGQQAFLRHRRLRDARCSPTMAASRRSSRCRSRP